MYITSLGFVDRDMESIEPTIISIFLAQIVVSFTEGGTTDDVKGDDGSSLRKVANTSSRNTHV